MTHRPHPPAQARCSANCPPVGAVISPRDHTPIQVLCWFEGAWVAGNYYSKKWFVVSVTGQPVQSQWSIHSSYVQDRVTVPRCAQFSVNAITVR